jgi:spore maturation protein CgeB
MKIGFYIQFNKYSISSKHNVIGDELFGESLCKSINKQFTDIKAELYAPNYIPKERLDLMIYLNETIVINEYAKKNIFYLQNAYDKEDYKTVVDRIVKNNYDGYIFFSKKIKDYYDINYKTPYSLYLPFGVDADFFSPQNVDPKFNFDCAYIGNDIKGEERSMKFLYPAVDFNFGLFGNWKIQKSRFKIWKNFKKVPLYKKTFERISKGKIAQEDVPKLYSSAKINLNVTAQSCIDWDVITLRTYEVLACRGFLITDKVPAAELTMKDCMVFTDGDDDLKEKIRYYLKNKDERIKISQRGYEYVNDNDSINNRAKELIKFIKDA